MWLFEKTGKKYRLPTEAEWEYSAKGGQSYKYSGSDNITDVAWSSENSGETTHDVGTKQSNAFGLYDMSGNVSEWCSDWYKGYSGSSGVTNYTGENRVIRGGSYGSGWGYCHPSSRMFSPPSYSYVDNGFRVCASIQ
jgi:formylglycine-generating enzyme required for sulfatase activity